jgi:predicted metal-binding membrane protein
MTDAPAVLSAGAIFAMWAVMMPAMMVPGGLPLVAVRGALALPGYVLVWIAFSAAAAVTHLGLVHIGVLSAEMTLRSAPLAALVVAAVGVYQLTPRKRAFLSRCRAQCAAWANAPRSGGWPAVADGMRYALSCAGCCWALMALLFVAGVMNVLAMAAIAAFVLAEKVVPRGLAFSKIAGAALLACGVVMALGISRTGLL